MITPHFFFLLMLKQFSLQIFASNLNPNLSDLVRCNTTYLSIKTLLLQIHLPTEPIPIPIKNAYHLARSTFHHLRALLSLLQPLDHSETIDLLTLHLSHELLKTLFLFENLPCPRQRKSKRI